MTTPDRKLLGSLSLAGIRGSVASSICNRTLARPQIDAYFPRRTNRGCYSFAWVCRSRSVYPSEIRVSVVTLHIPFGDYPRRLPGLVIVRVLAIFEIAQTMLRNGCLGCLESPGIVVNLAGFFQAGAPLVSFLQDRSN